MSSHFLTAKAYDAAGNIGTSQSVTVTVSNAPAVPIPGDINLDHIINSLDFAVLKSNWGKTW